MSRRALYLLALFFALETITVSGRTPRPVQMQGVEILETVRGLRARAADATSGRAPLTTRPRAAA